MTELRQRRPRIKNPKHLAWIRTQPCCICGDNTSVEAAHIRSTNLVIGKDDFGWGRPNDEFVTPLCGYHHREQHAMGDEMKFWMSYRLNPFAIAAALVRMRTK